MTSTEQKNVSQHFINSCFTFGVYPTLISNAFGNSDLDTDAEPFRGLGPTRSISGRIRQAADPMLDCRNLFPVLSTAGPFTRLSPFLLWVCRDSRIYYGNQAVYRFAESVIIRRWHIHFAETGAYKHAQANTARTASYLASGSYGSVSRTDANVRTIAHRDDSAFLRRAADVCELLASNTRHHAHARGIKYWCYRTRRALGYNITHRKASSALEAYRTLNCEAIYTCDHPEALRSKWIYVSKSSKINLKIYCIKGTYFIRVEHKYKRPCIKRLVPHSAKTHQYVSSYNAKTGPEVFVLSHRDLIDLGFVFTAASQVKLYHSRRLHDAVDRAARESLKKLQVMMWHTYLNVMRMCGDNFDLRNKLGVYFDVLQWRYLAWRSGDEFYNHSAIMKDKIKSKGLTRLPPQEELLSLLRECPVDIAVDMLGMYKASIYPEVDPFRVIAEQHKLHMSRFQTDWEEGSPEERRFSETRSYMWYLGVRVLKSRFGIWPGKIREGVDRKEWHDSYKRSGIPNDNWRDSHDVDLTGSLTVADITDEAYFKQQDSACAPPLWYEYANYAAMRNAPRRHKRKLLYAIQESLLPSLPDELLRLNEIGRDLPDAYVGQVEYTPSFSTDIVTGSRCERHKDSPRPFYAASPPWGCIISYFDGITRDFLSHVPQSMLGKSTRQKFLDLSTTAYSDPLGTDTFYMSDDKAKYSPRMDPNSQQLPADFFSELFNIPGIKAYGPVMYHCKLYYRVHGHLVHYNSNGTDREGMRGASNTWLEIVAQGLSTRLSRERGLIRGKSIFLSFIDDGLRKFSISTRGKTHEEKFEDAKKVIEDVIFGLKVLGRELSWDKTFISRDMFVILNELVIDGAFISSGLKSFCTIGDLEMKEVMTAADYEQLYFGKLRGAHGVGTPIDLCHYVYIFETMMSHYKMGLSLQDNKRMSRYDYRLFCCTPIALGGGGLRSALQMCCTEVATATKEGIGNLMRLGQEYPLVMASVTHILNQPLEQLSPVDFMREPEQFHVSGPRIKTQRLAAEVRKQLRNLACNSLSREYIEQDRLGMELLTKMGKVMMSMESVSAEEVRLLYATTPVAFIDEFIQKLASSATLSEMLSRDTIKAMRRLAKQDLVVAANYFCKRCASVEMYKFMTTDIGLVAMMRDIIG